MSSNDNCVVMLVGHGATSNPVNPSVDSIKPKAELKPNIIDNYILAYPVAPDNALEVFGHNLLLHSFADVLTPHDKLTKIMQTKAASHCDKTKQYYGPMANSSDAKVKAYIKELKNYTNAEHSIGNADDILLSTKALLPDQITDYVVIQSVNFSSYMENDMKKNLAVRNTDADATPQTPFTFTTGLGELAIYYNKKKVENALLTYKNNRRQRVLAVLETYNLLNKEIEDLTSGTPRSSEQDAMNVIKSIINYKSDRDKDITAVYNEALNSGTFDDSIFNNLRVYAVKYINDYKSYKEYESKITSFDKNHLVYMTLQQKTANTRGLRCYWSSFLQSVGSLYIAFENDLMNEDSKTFSPVKAWFLTGVDDDQLWELDDELDGKYLIMSIPVDANILFSACRYFSKAQMTDDPTSTATPKAQIEIFPEF